MVSPLPLLAVGGFGLAVVVFEDVICFFARFFREAEDLFLVRVGMSESTMQRRKWFVLLAEIGGTR
jgi:hypothetical protein